MLRSLGSFSGLDHHIFQERMRLPAPYLAEAFTRYKTVAEMSTNVIKVITGCHQKLAEGKVLSIQERKFVAYGVPIQYVGKIPKVTASTESGQKDFEWLALEVAKWVPRGKTFYFHGTFNSEGSIAAGAVIARCALEKSLHTYMTSWPSVLESVYQWDPSDPIIQKVKGVELLVLWGVGLEHTTDFTQSKFRELLETREMGSKSTVICTGLAPSEYFTRYNTEHPGIGLGFQGKLIKETIASIKKEIEKRG